MSTHGGRRAGSGRKPLPPEQKTVTPTVAVRIPPDLLALLDAYAGKSRSSKIVSILRKELLS